MILCCVILGYVKWQNVTEIVIADQQSSSSLGGGIPVVQDRGALAKDDCKMHRAEREKASANDTGDDADDMMTLTNTDTVPLN